MQFLADVYVECESCQGKRYNRETLEVRYRGRSISEVLDLTVLEATDLFIKHPPVLNRLETLDAVGLGYLKLGQAANTLSGGEAQRLKLSMELAGNKMDAPFIYWMNRPLAPLVGYTKITGFTFKLRDSGNTLVIIEHNLDVIRLADHVIEIGPSGGRSGGKLIFEGNPEKVGRERYSNREISCQAPLFILIRIFMQADSVDSQNKNLEEPDLLSTKRSAFWHLWKRGLCYW